MGNPPLLGSLITSIYLKLVLQSHCPAFYLGEACRGLLRGDDNDLSMSMIKHGCNHDCIVEVKDKSDYVERGYQVFRSLSMI